jgi:hypothetical protein
MRLAEYIAYIGEPGELTEKSEGMRPLRRLGMDGMIISKENFKK